MDEDPAATLHRLTKHGTYDPDRAELLVRFRPLDPTNQPAPFRRWVGREVEPLPVAEGPVGPPALDVLSRDTVPARPELDAETLARLLFLASGVTRSVRRGGHATYFRAAMSAGNLHPVESYVVAGDVEGLDAGVHHFAPLEVGLTRLRAGDHRDFLHGAAADAAVAHAPATLVLTGLPWRTGWKYGERGWRHLYWDAGTMLANLLVVAAALGVGARVLTGFVDGAVERLVGADGVGEMALALVVLGDTDREQAATVVPADPGELGPPAVQPRPLARAPIEFPLVTAAQAGGVLTSAEGVRAWRARAHELGRPADTELASPSSAGDETVDVVIRRRGSTRIMRHETAPAQLLRWGLAAGARAVPCDWAGLERTLLEHDVSVHAVEGFAPGAYRYRAGGEFEPLRTGDRAAAREVASRLCLDQPLGGDSAFTAFHAAELEPILEALGGRGYRAAQLEAGIVAGRLSLAAFALGAGATGLTFYDDGASAFFRTLAAPMLVTAVGFPDYGNAPGGTARRPVELGRYDELMRRLSVGLQRARRA